MFKYFTLRLWLVVVCAGLCVWTQNADAANAGAANELRSAYLGTSVWSEDLSPTEINDQLKDHFAEVLVQLEAKNASSLLTALIRAEATSPKRWNKVERRTALNYLARNRQLQIKRLRDYMNQGVFPLNEGQAPDAVPIFVDRHDTHCAVGHLMHSDGEDTKVAQIVSANNLVRIRSVDRGGMVQWIRTSGLTQEEAAMIQPAYPVFGVRSFAGFLGPAPVQTTNGFTISDVSVRGTRFDATLPTSFQTTPSAIDAVFQLGVMELNNSAPLASTFLNNAGFASGAAGTGGDPFVGQPGGTPGNLDDWLYIGPNDALFGNLFDGSFGVPGNVRIIEIEYQIRADVDEFFSRVGLASNAAAFGFGPQNFVNNFENNANSEQNAVLVLSEIYRGGTNVLLGEQQLFVAGDPQSVDFQSGLVGSEITPVSEDFLRIRNYGLVVGGGRLHRVFNEFQSIPEPSSSVAVLLIGAFAIRRRNRRTIAN